jgi:hypothetical protein
VTPLALLLLRLSALAVTVAVAVAATTPAVAATTPPGAETPAAAMSLSPAETRGREIFLHGTSPSGREVTAVIGGNPSPTPLACASCHGRDGRGRPEAGVRPANLEWETLTRASAARPAYDAARLVRAITMGIDPAGHPLDPAMPRYRLWREDADDLIAWLQRLGALHDPGIEDTTIHLHIAGPMRRVFQAWADRVNAAGGIYARKIALTTNDDGDAAFAILGDPDEPLTRAAIANEVPVLRAGTIAGPDGPWVFELGPDAADEMKQLRAAAAALPAAPQLALIPSAIASEALPHLRGDAYVAARILPTDVDREAASRYAETLTNDRLVDQWSALAIATLTERALTRAGRDLTREAFVTALTSEYEARTGFAPPVTFTATQRHGIRTVRILHYNHATRQLTPIDRR